MTFSASSSIITSMLAKKSPPYSIIFFRFLIASFILIVNTALFGLSHTQVYSLISAIYVLTIIYSLLALAKLHNIGLLYLQIVIDLVIVTLLIHFTGGIDSVLGILFPLLTVAAGITISPRAAVITALLGSIMYAGAVNLEFFNIVRLPITKENTLIRESSYVFSLLYLRVTIFCVIGFLVAYISEQVSKKDKTVILLEKKLRQEDRLSAIGKLAASAAHEIRNPLASISGCVEALKGNLNLEGQNEKLFNLIIKETMRLNDIINGLLEYVKPRKLQSDKISISELLDEVIFLVKTNKEFKKDVLIKKEGVWDNQKASCDPQQIKQVFFNLLVNAVEAVDKHGKIVIRQKIDKQRQELEIQVTDNGIGISQELQESLFEPFSSGKDKGVGLGLAIALSIIKEHKGSITVESKPGRGTTFHIFLPMAGRKE